ncbi:MAG: phospholipase D-like domain-containing protein [Chryseolinea sp.]
MVKKSFNVKSGYVSDNTVKLIHGGSEYFELLENLIDGAKEIIHLQVYIFEDDETGMKIANALIKAAQRGVQVYLLLDGYASRPLSSEFTQGMKTSGVYLRWFQPLFKADNFFVGRRMHHKIFVADASRSLVGGLNISDRYNDMPGVPAWLDWAVYVVGQTSVELHNRCVQMWFRKPPARRNVPSIKPATVDECLVRVRINDWFRNKNQISRSYGDMLRYGQKSVTFMSSYFMPGRIFRKNLRLASHRGIRVRIILTKISDVFIAKQAERFFYPWLLRRNVEIYEYRKKVLHGKIAVCDDLWSTIGSYNLNDLSAYVSIELNLDIHNPKFSQALADTLENIIQIDCDHITEESLIRSTNWWNRVIYRIAYAVGRMFLIVFTFPLNRERPLNKTRSK